jgi:hypothetical protein
MRKISETTFKDGGHALRSVHAKSHALLRGRLEVLPDLPATLAQGLLPETLSTTSSAPLDDPRRYPRRQRLGAAACRSKS